MTNELFRHDRHVAVRFIGGFDEFPFHGWRDGRDTAINLAIEILDDFRAGAVPTTSSPS